MSSWTDVAYQDDPANCKVGHAGACDPGSEDALAAFPYWDYRAENATPDNAGTVFFLGVSGGYLWAVTCNHCNTAIAALKFVSGPYAGRAFDTVGPSGQPGSGPFAQFGSPAISTSNPGNILYRLQPKPGESLPDLPFVRLLPV